MRKLVVAEFLLALVLLGVYAQCSQQVALGPSNATQAAQTRTAEPVAAMWTRLAVTREARATNQALIPTPVPVSPTPTIAYPVLVTERTFQNYTIRIYQNSSASGAFEIMRDSVRLWGQADVYRFWLGYPHKEHAELERIAMGQDITGDGKPNLVVERWTGGVHCCTFFSIFEIADQFKYIATLENGHTPMEQVNFVNLDRDPALEFATHDWTFAYWRACFACSPAPQVILRYEDGAYQLACDLMRQPIPSEAELARLVQEIQATPEWEAGMPPVALWRTMLDLIYGGNAEVAQQLLEDAWPGTTSQRVDFWIAFLSQLSESPYWDGLLECNPDLVPMVLSLECGNGNPCLAAPTPTPWPLEVYPENQDQRTVVSVIPGNDEWLAIWDELNTVLQDAGSLPQVDGFVQLLSEALNTDQVQVDRLAEWLAERGFLTSRVYPAVNLFGEGQTVKVFKVQPRRQDWLQSDASIVLILRGERAGEYHLTSLRDTWFRHLFHSGDRVTIDDYTGDGQSEILSVLTYCGHMGCSSVLALHKWKGDRRNGQFVDVAANVEGYWGISYDNIWRFGDADADRWRPLIKTDTWRNHAGDGCQPYQLETHYSWTDQGYQFAATEPVPLEPIEPIHCAIGWAGLAMDSRKAVTVPDVAIPVLESALENWTDTLDSIWGPGAEQYFRFKLAMWHSRQGQVDLATMALQDIIENPKHAEFTLIPDIARVYLTRYQVEQDHDTACAAAVEAAFATIPDPDSFEDWWNIIEWAEDNWGFAEPSWLWVLGPIPIDRFDICDPAYSYPQ